MDKEFHYWVTGLVAEYAGFPPADCRKLAYSAQYVDDNKYHVEVYDGEFDVFPSYVSHVSQTEDITQPKADIMKIYPLFHFIPGDKDVAASARNDGKTHPLLTTPNSSYARKIMEYTLQNARSRYPKDKSCLHRIGIAAHCYVDTWAHQNFSGWFDDLNGLPNYDWPNIGHFDPGHNPDLIHNEWQDERLVDAKVENNPRFKDAAENLYTYLSSFCIWANQSPRGNWNTLAAFLDSTWDEKDNSTRIQRYRGHSKYLPEYDDRILEAGAFTRKMVTEVDGTHREKCLWRTEVKKRSTEWFRFQEAVKGHIIDSSTILRPAFLEAGVHI